LGGVNAYDFEIHTDWPYSTVTILWLSCCWKCRLCYFDLNFILPPHLKHTHSSRLCLCQTGHMDLSKFVHWMCTNQKSNWSWRLWM